MPDEYRHKPTAVFLSCKHTAYFSPPPKAEDTVYCLRCSTWQTYVTVACWTVRCAGCPWARNYGDDETSARRTSIKHVARFPGHTVHISYAGTLDSEVKAQDPPIPGSLPDRYHTVIL